MPRVTIELQEAAHLWLVAEATSRRMSVEDVLNELVSERFSVAALDAHESYVLRLIQNISAKPGWPVPARALWTNWQLRGSLAELSKALEGLARKNMVLADQGFTEFRLTEAGFAAGR